jgi:hypothetical protein
MYNSSPRPAFAKQIMSTLLILCYKGIFVTWTAVTWIAAKFKPLLFSRSLFAVSYARNMFIILILYDSCVSPAQFRFTVVCIREAESRVQTGNQFAP